MGNFRPNGRSGGFGGGRSSGGFGGGRGGFRRDDDRGGSFRRERAEMHDATCAKCGKACQVPFRPTGDRPVLCSACFETSGNSRSNGNGGNAGGISSEQFNQLNAKLDKIIEILGELEIVSDEDDLDEEMDLESDDSQEPKVE